MSDNDSKRMKDESDDESFTSSTHAKGAKSRLPEEALEILRYAMSEDFGNDDDGGLYLNDM